ncbi:GntR family transcriptional regulator [Streptomyces sp. NPDC088789]|uniref:GntR family transcriptional regulator n=1 Tax=Streptomyces sp. NPDC088789 TaxID=3365899 RepID=UPI003813AE0E
MSLASLTPAAAKARPVPPPGPQTGPTTDPPVLTGTQAQSLRTDLTRCVRLPRARFTSPAALATDTAVLQQCLLRWVPLPRTCRAAEAKSPSATAGWDALLEAAVRPPHTPATTESVTLLSSALRDLLRAITRATAPGPSIAELTEHLTTGIRSGRYLAGTVLSRHHLSRSLRCSHERIEAALADLTARHILERHGTRLFVPVTADAPAVRARYIADRLRAQMATGIYPPGTHLPTIAALSRAFVCGPAPVRAAQQLLAADGLLRLPGGRSRPHVPDTAPALPPPPRSEPPPGGPRSTDDNLLLLGAVRRQWLHHSSVAATDITEQWHRLRRLATTVPQQHTDRDSLLLADLATAPLPDPAWLRPWHLAILATALRNARKTAPGLPPADTTAATEQTRQ